MELVRSLRRIALLVLVAAVVAGCASPNTDESTPDDLNCDGDRDGVPDGTTSSDATNQACDDATNTTLDNETVSDNDNETQPMPGVLP